MCNRQKATITGSILAVWLMVSVIGMAQQSTESQQPAHHSDDVIKLESTLVAVPVIVSDRGGRYIPGLQRDDFLVTEDGVGQSIAQFSISEEPVTVAILIDASSSASERLSRIKQAAITFVNQLRPQDLAMVISFSDHIYINSGFTADGEALEDAIRAVERGHSTELYEAIYLTASQQLAPLKGRKAIVLFSDGLDTSSLSSRDQVLRYMEESGTFLYAVHFDPGSPYRSVYTCSGNFWNILGPRAEKVRNEEYTEPVLPAKQGEEFLQQIAQVSGGRYYRSKEVGSERKSTAAMEQIADELRHQYVMGYYATNNRHDGTFRRIRVRVRSGSGLAVRARSGYRAPLQGDSRQAASQSER